MNIFRQEFESYDVLSEKKKNVLRYSITNVSQFTYFVHFWKLASPEKDYRGQLKPVFVM